MRTSFRHSYFSSDSSGGPRKTISSAGIATGYATLGRIGFEGRYDHGAIGPVTNLAARLGGDAKAGQILLSQRAFAQIEERIDVEPMGEITVKGYSRPQAAYNVLRIKEHVPA